MFFKSGFGKVKKRLPSKEKRRKNLRSKIPIKPNKRDTTIDGK